MFRKYSYSDNMDFVQGKGLDEFDWNYLEISPIEKSEESNSKITKKLKTYFSLEEDKLLLLQVDQYGKKWKRMAHLFPNKTYRMLRNRYMKIKQNKQNDSSMQESTSELIKKQRKIPDYCQLERIKSQIDLISLLVKQTKNELLQIYASRNTN